MSTEAKQQKIRRHLLCIDGTLSTFNGIYMSFFHYEFYFHAKRFHSKYNLDLCCPAAGLLFFRNVQETSRYESPAQSAQKLIVILEIPYFTTQPILMRLAISRWSDNILLDGDRKIEIHVAVGIKTATLN